MNSASGGASSGPGTGSHIALSLEEIHGASPDQRAAGDTAGSFMQSLFWARFKAKTGWRAYSCSVGLPSESHQSTLVVLVRRLGPGFAFAYVPHGPGEIPPSIAPNEFLEFLSNRLSAMLGKRLLFIRYDVPWEKEDKKARELLDVVRARTSRLRTGSPVQVPDTVILDLRKTEEEILAGMKPKWRYNIRLAEKKEVEVKREGIEGLPVFQALYEETARRDGIAIHPLSYYETLFETASEFRKEAPASGIDVSVWTARHEGQPLASIITLFFARHATYLYGASSNEKRNLMPAYALQWSAIKAAKEAGCIDYDFFGIPPSEDPHHPMAGLYLFKTGFGGKIVHRAGCVDYPSSPSGYRLFRAAELLRLFWHKKAKKWLSGMLRGKLTTRRA